MKLIERLTTLMKEKKKVFINGIPKEDGGTILAIEDDYVSFEVISGENKDKKKEVIDILTSTIEQVSEGALNIGGLNGFKEEETKVE